MTNADPVSTLQGCSEDPMAASLRNPGDLDWIGTDMTQEPLTLERAVARFVVNYRSADIDDATRSAVKALIKDQFANQIGAARLPWSQKTRAFRNPRPGKATIVGEATKSAAVDAAYLNASYGHGFEYDDFFGNAHPGCCVVPAAFALGEELGATLEETLVALVAGYETYVRIGRWGSPAVLNVGWQPHAVFANFGAAAVAAKHLKLDEEQTFHALAIALSHAAAPPSMPRPADPSSGSTPGSRCATASRRPSLRGPASPAPSDT